MNSPFDYQKMFGASSIQTRREVFVSYQHSSDQAYYDAFSRMFHDAYEIIYDNSLERKIDSDNHDYVIQGIRDEFITGTSCTVVLCGPTSYQRKYIDWEVKATLEKEHGLIAIQLPSLVPAVSGSVTVPTRVNQNIHAGFAIWKHWNQLSAATFGQWVEEACTKRTNLIVNPREIKQRNG